MPPFLVERVTVTLGVVIGFLDVLVVGGLVGKGVVRLVVIVVVGAKVYTV